MNTSSIHYAEERRSRREFIDQYIGEGNIVASFVVNNGHPGGAEIHDVTDTAIIIVRNQKTGKLITELIARPEQLKRLYALIGEKPPSKLLSLAYKHNAKKYNER